jgi:hypothetical protein
MVKTQNKLNEELIAINDWFKRLIYELTQPIDLNLSLNNVVDVQDSMTVSFSFVFYLKEFNLKLFSNLMHRLINVYQDLIKLFMMNQI